MNMYKVNFSIVNQNNIKRSMELNIGWEGKDVPSNKDVEFFLERDYLKPHEILFKRLDIEKIEFLEKI